MTPLIHPPEGALKRALTTLEPGESWLVEPRIDAENPRLVSPGVKIGVAPGSFTHLNELFGPVLAVMRARNLDHAIELVNATGYGLTAGLASLDEREQARFTGQIRAGNVYVNRTITGAVVQRQPFGGLGKSGFGPGAKAGGPNYVLQLCHVKPLGTPPVDLAALDVQTRAHLEALCAALGPAEASLLCARASDYARADTDHFARDHDPQKVLGQDNVFRYRPSDNVVLRVQPDASLVDVASSCLAAEIAGARLSISIDPGFKGPADATLWGHPVQVETAAQLVERLRGAVKLRLLGARTAELERASELHGAHIADEPVLAIGRLELLHYVREQSVSVDYHRYGNLGIRGQIPRANPESTDSARPRDR